MAIRRLILICSLLLAGIAAACSESQKPTPTVGPTSIPVAATTAEEPTLIPPPDTRDEHPLQAAAHGVPEVYLVPAVASLQALADYLHTEAEQLKRVNPSLGETVSAGTLVVIPSSYHTSKLSSVKDIADATGHTVDTLLAANPELSADQALDEGAVVRVPPVTVLREAATLAAAANDLGISQDVLLSANPELAANEPLEPGAVLIVPLVAGGEE